MKRVEAIIPANKLKSVVEALEGKVGGFLAWEAKGRGSGARPTVRMGRGTRVARAEYNQVVSVVTIVDDDKVNAVVDVISGAVYTGESGDGVIAISTVDDVVNIASKKRGSEAL